jgi:hypothetical protein
MHLNPDQARRLLAVLLPDETDNVQSGNGTPSGTEATDIRVLARRGVAGNLNDVGGSESVLHASGPRESRALDRSADSAG